MKVFRDKTGQAAVESAIVLPLHIFLLLGIIQWGLIAQARVMAKYAAYRAVRVGAMQHADHDKMVAAALFALLPVISMPSSNGVQGAELIKPTLSASDVDKKFAEAILENKAMGAVGAPMVDVVICGPLHNDVANYNETTYGQGSSTEVDFDDPRVSTEGYQSNNTPNVTNPQLSGSQAPPSANPGNDVAGSYAGFLRTKLRIQVQYLYRMPIPFANWVISMCYLGVAAASQLPVTLNMTEKPTDLAGGWQPGSGGSKEFKEAALLFNLPAESAYVVPINVNYAMRMQSDFYLTGSTDLPTQNLCVHY